jgi:hypothetical protein
VAGALATRSIVTDDDLVAVLDDLDRIREAALGPVPTAGGTR